MNFAQGKDLMLSVNGVALACAEEITISFSSRFLSTRNRANTGWRTSIPGQKSFTIGGNGGLVYVNRGNFYNPFEERTLVQFVYQTDNPIDGSYSGSAWVQTFGEISNAIGYARYNFSMIGNGKPALVEALGIGTMAIEGSPAFEVF